MTRTTTAAALTLFSPAARSRPIAAAAWRCWTEPSPRWHAAADSVPPPRSWAVKHLTATFLASGIRALLDELPDGVGRAVPDPARLPGMSIGERREARGGSLIREGGWIGAFASYSGT